MMAPFRLADDGESAAVSRVHFDHVRFGALDEGDDFVVFGLRNLKFFQRRVGVLEEMSQSLSLIRIPLWERAMSRPR